MFRVPSEGVLRLVNHDAALCAIRTSAGMPRPVCSLRIMANVNGNVSGFVDLHQSSQDVHVLPHGR